LGIEKVARSKVIAAARGRKIGDRGGKKRAAYRLRREKGCRDDGGGRPRATMLRRTKPSVQEKG